MLLTLCPKCAYQRLPTDSHIHEGICPACGIVYQKFLDRQNASVEAAPDPFQFETVPAPRALLRARLLEMPVRVDAISVGGRAALWCALALWAVWFTLHGIDYESTNSSFLHHINLPFHEFGHVLFMPFGDFMSILGGSLFQVLMPLGLAAAFLLRQRDAFGASVTFWWCGQSLVDLAPYVGDAVGRALPLIGGLGPEAHDWGNLLTTMGLLNHAQGLARLCFTAGVLVMLVALSWGAKLLRLQHAQLVAGRDPGSLLGKRG